MESMRQRFQAMVDVRACLSRANEHSGAHGRPVAKPVYRRQYWPQSYVASVGAIYLIGRFLYWRSYLGRSCQPCGRFRTVHAADPRPSYSARLSALSVTTRPNNSSKTTPLRGAA